MAMIITSLTLMSNVNNVKYIQYEGIMKKESILFFVLPILICMFNYRLRQISVFCKKQNRTTMRAAKRRSVNQRGLESLRGKWLARLLEKCPQFIYAGS